MKRYHITLSAEERQHLEGLLSRGKADVRKLKHAQVLLRVDESPEGPGWTDERVAEAVGVGTATIERLRRRFVEDCFEAALSHYKGPDRVYRTKLDGLQEAHLITLACSQPPSGRGRWTLKLLADRLVALGHVDAVSIETVRKTLKKTACGRI
jgi:transposase